VVRQFGLLVHVSLLTGKKVKVFAVHAMKACRESRGIAPLILNVDTIRGRGDGQLHAPTALILRENPGTH
jgi:hypothetical protein